MAIKMQDLGELGYGGLVTLTAWWDDKRIAEGKITEKDVLKKASFYGYLIPGGFCTLTSAFGWVRALKPWDEHISHGFIYDFPRFIKDMVTSMRTEGGAAAAVKEAQRIVYSRKALGAGRPVDRYPAPVGAREFEDVRLVG